MTMCASRRLCSQLLSPARPLPCHARAHYCLVLWVELCRPCGWPAKAASVKSSSSKKGKKDKDKKSKKDKKDSGSSSKCVVCCA